jgi:hypothetical protein
MDPKYQIFDVGFSADKPSVKELDSLDSRMAVVRGKIAGINQPAIANAHAAIDKISSVADRVAQTVIDPIEDRMRVVAITQGNAYIQSTNDIANRLANVRAVAQKVAPPAPKPKRLRKGSKAATAAANANDPPSNSSLASTAIADGHCWNADSWQRQADWCTQ